MLTWGVLSRKNRAAGRPSSSDRRLRHTILAFSSEQPSANVVCHGSQPLILDVLPVDAGHIWAFVPHDVVDGRLVLGAIGNRPMRVPQRVEVAVTIQAKLVQH